MRKLYGDMQIQYLEHFLAVVEHGNLTRAAESLFISQPTLSRQMLSLEQNLGVRLFDRKGHNLTLTEAGEVYLSKVRSALHELRQASLLIEQIKKGEEGFLRIAVPFVPLRFLVVPALVTLRNIAPKVQVHIIEAEHGSVLTLLERGDVHLAIGAPLPASDNLAWETLYVARVYAFVQPHHPLASKSYVTIDDLLSEQLLLLKFGRSTEMLFEITYRVAGFHPQSMVESTSPEALLSLAENGFGIALLSDSIPYEGYDLRALPVVQEHRQLQSTAIIAWHRRRHLSEAGRQLISVLKQQAALRRTTGFTPWQAPDRDSES